jgi:transposase
MYGSRSRKVKTDKRDAAALAEACRTGIYRPAHRASAAARDLRRHLRVRSHLVRQRTQTMSLLRSLLRQERRRVASGSAERISHTPRSARAPRGTCGGGVAVARHHHAGQYTAR